MSRPLVWLVASEDTARRWGEAVDAAGFEVVRLAFSRIEAVGNAPTWRARLETVRPDLVLLTSPSALDVLPPDFGAGQAAVCVGETTARRAAERGFAVAHVGPGTGVGLAAEMTADAPGRLLFLRGRDVRSETVEAFREAGWEMEEEIVYEALPRDAFPDEVAAAPDPAAIVLGSPRAAEGLAAALATASHEDLRTCLAIAIGPTTLRSLRDLGFHRISAPATPSAQALADHLRSLLAGTS